SAPDWEWLNSETPRHREITMIGPLETAGADRDHHGIDAAAAFGMKRLHAGKLVSQRAAPARGYRFVFVDQRRLEAAFGRDLQKAKTDTRAEQGAAFRRVHRSFFEPKLKRAVDRRKDRPGIYAHPEGIGRELRHRTPACRKAAILIQDIVGND